MDITTIIIVIVALLFGATVMFFLAPKVKNGSEKKSEVVSNEKEIKLFETLNRLEIEKANLEKILNEKNKNIAILLDRDLKNEKSEDDQDKKIQILISQLKHEIENLENKNKYILDEKDKLIEQINIIEKQKTEILESNQKIIEELQNLKKETIQLKDDLEDCEDQIADLEKKNKRLNKEFNDLDDEKYIIEKEKNQILYDKEKILKKLEKAENECKNQKESLNFISDILNANNAINEKYEEVDHKTWEILTNILNDLKYYLEDRGSQIFTDDFEFNCLSWRNQEIKTWIKGKKVVAIVGEFSAGKTSIVNRILKQDDPNVMELPVKSTETTAVPTYISQGIDFNCQFYSPSGEIKNISPESFQKVTKSVVDDINISSLIKYFVLSYNNKNLANISILDTPGFSSKSQGIIDKTTEVINEADALLWVVDANTGEINNSSLKVIEKNLQNVPLHIIINKSDTKSQVDLEELKIKIEDTLQKNNILFNEIIFFSQESELDDLLNILNKIQPKKTPRVISIITQEIDKTLKHAKKDLSDLRNESNIIRNEFENNKSKLKQTIDDLVYSIKDIESVISHEMPFFGSDYYKIKKIDFEKFNKSLNKISNSSAKFPDLVYQFVTNNEDSLIKEEYVNELKNFIKNLEKEKKNFSDLVNQYNPNLLN